MDDAYDELRHAIMVDEAFVHLALDIERHLGILDRVAKVRVKAWLAKLREQVRARLSLSLARARPERVCACGAHPPPATRPPRPRRPRT
jgi:hypothetical protein